MVNGEKSLYKKANSIIARNLFSLVPTFDHRVQLAVPLIDKIISFQCDDKKIIEMVKCRSGRHCHENSLL